jgi:hypothetical protein
VIQKLGNISDDEVAQALDRLGQHVPIGESFGRPLIAERDGRRFSS